MTLSIVREYKCSDDECFSYLIPVNIQSANILHLINLTKNPQIIYELIDVQK